MCAWMDCALPPRAHGVCRRHLGATLAAGRRSTYCTEKTARLDRLVLARYGIPWR